MEALKVRCVLERERGEDLHNRFWAYVYHSAIYLIMDRPITGAAELAQRKYAYVETIHKECAEG